MLRKYLVALTDQSIASAFAFVLTVILIKTWEPGLFGIFAFWQTILLLVIGVQNALINTPLIVFLPASQSNSDLMDLENVLASANTTFVVLVIVIAIASSPLLPGVSSNAIVAGIASAAFLSSGLLREYSRSRCFGHQQPLGAFQITGISLLVSSSILVIAALAPDHLDLPLLFGILSLAAFIASMFGQKKGHKHSSKAGFQMNFRGYQPVWIQSKWALVGVLTTNIQGRGYVYLVTATAGLKALALVAAAEIVFRPVGLLITAWGRVAQPRLAEVAGRNDTYEYYRIVKFALLTLTMANVVLAAGLYLAWPTIKSLLYGERYQDIGYLVIAWGLVVFIASIRAVFSICLKSLKKFKPLATATIAGSAVFLLSALFILTFLGFRYILISLIAAELVTLLYVLTAYFKHRPVTNLQYVRGSKSCVM